MLYNKQKSLFLLKAIFLFSKNIYTFFTGAAIFNLGIYSD